VPIPLLVPEWDILVTRGCFGHQFHAEAKCEPELLFKHPLVVVFPVTALVMLMLVLPRRRCLPTNHFQMKEQSVSWDQDPCHALQPCDRAMRKHLENRLRDGGLWLKGITSVSMIVGLTFSDLSCHNTTKQNEHSHWFSHVSLLQTEHLQQLFVLCGPPEELPWTSLSCCVPSFPLEKHLSLLLIKESILTSVDVSFSFSGAFPSLEEEASESKRLSPVRCGASKLQVMAVHTFLVLSMPSPSILVCCARQVLV
jgi:hypothetical protein